VDLNRPSRFKKRPSSHVVAMPGTDNDMSHKYIFMQPLRFIYRSETRPPPGDQNLPPKANINDRLPDIKY
jgi:hypothetical protein